MFRKTPFFVDFLKDYIEEWTETQNAIVITPKANLAKFDKLIFIKKRIGFAEHKWEIRATYPIFQPEDFSSIPEEKKKLFQELKSYEVEMFWKGLVKKTPFFKSYKGLILLSKIVDGLKPKDVLAKELNSNHYVIELIQKIEPEEVKVVLPGGIVAPPPPMPNINKTEYYRTAYTALYQSPKEIVFVNIVTKHFYFKFKGHKQTIRDIFNLMNLLCNIEEKIVRIAENQLS